MCKGSKKVEKTEESRSANPIYDAFFTKLLGKADPLADQKWTPYTGELVADASGAEQSAWGELEGGAGDVSPYYDAAGALALSGSGGTADMIPRLGDANTAGLGSSAYNWLQESTGEGPQYSAQAIQQYQDPYLEQVLNQTLGWMGQADAQQQQQLTGNAIAKGAWGSDRAGLAKSDLARNQGDVRAKTISSLLSQSFTNAQDQFRQSQTMDAQRRARLLQASNQGFGAFGDEATRRASAMSADRDRALRGAGVLSDVGQSSQATTLARLNALLKAGGDQRALQQQKDTSAYDQYQKGMEFDRNNLSWLANLSQGLSAASGQKSTATKETPGPDPMSQLIGLIVGGAKVAQAASGFADGGKIKAERSSPPTDGGVYVEPEDPPALGMDGYWSVPSLNAAEQARMLGDMLDKTSNPITILNKYRGEKLNRQRAAMTARAEALDRQTKLLRIVQEDAGDMNRLRAKREALAQEALSKVKDPNSQAIGATDLARMAYAGIIRAMAGQDQADYKGDADRQAKKLLADKIRLQRERLAPPVQALQPLPIPPPLRAPATDSLEAGAQPGAYADGGKTGSPKWLDALASLDGLMPKEEPDDGGPRITLPPAQAPTQSYAPPSFAGGGDVEDEDPLGEPDDDSDDIPLAAAPTQQVPALSQQGAAAPAPKDFEARMAGLMDDPIFLLGMNIAAGQSPFGLSNISQGALTTAQGLSKRKHDLEALKVNQARANAAMLAAQAAADNAKANAGAKAKAYDLSARTADRRAATDAQRLALDQERVILAQKAQVAAEDAARRDAERRAAEADRLALGTETDVASKSAYALKQLSDMAAASGDTSLEPLIQQATKTLAGKVSQPSARRAAPTPVVRAKGTTVSADFRAMSQADAVKRYNALKSGDSFYDDQGHLRVKP